MTGEEFRTLRHTAGLSVRAAAQVCGVAPSTIQRWEQSDGADITAQAQDALTARLRGLPPELRTAYHTGRLVALLEAASGEPLSLTVTHQLAPLPGRAIGTLMRVARQPQNRERYRELDPLIAEAMSQIPAPGWPEMLGAAEEGSLWLGYEHQRAELQAGAKPDQ